MNKWDALFEKPDRSTEPPPADGPPLTGARADAYVEAAIAAECLTVSTAPESTRNDRLNTAAFNLGQFIGAGHVAEVTIRDGLTVAARAVGLDEHEIGPTITSGIRGGKQHPRIITATSNGYPPVTTTVTTPTDPAAIRDHLPLLDWHDLWADDEEEEWILEPLLPARRLVALYSAPKLGKSLLMLEIAVRVSQGLEVLGVTPDRARRVLYVDFENDPRGDIRTRLQRIGVGPDDLTDLCYLSFPRLAKLDTAQGGWELMAAVTEYQCEVVIIDTISRAVAGEENDNDTWLAFYRSTGMVLKAAGITCMRLDHTGKDAEKGMRGGSAKYGDVDAVWKLAAVTDTMLRLDCTDHRMPISEKTVVVRRHHIPRLWHQVEAEGRMAAYKEKVTELVAILDGAGAEDDLGRDKAREVVRAVGIHGSNDALSEALRQRKARLQPFGEEPG